MGQAKIKATIYDKNGNILSQAENNYNKSHPIQAKFAEKAGQPERIFLHAEIAALIKLERGMKPYRIFVERRTKDDRPALAQPCPVCMAAIKHYGVEHVEFTI